MVQTVSVREDKVESTAEQPARQVRKLPWLWLWVIPALLLVALMVLVLKPAKEPAKATFQAANGNVLTFLGVTYGRTNIMPIGKPYQQTLYKLLPEKLKKWSGARAQTFTVSNTNNPSFWVHESQAAPMVRAGGGAGFGSGFRPAFLGLGEQPRIMDEYGCEFAPTGTSTSSSSSSGDRLTLINVYGNPPQGRMAALCLYDLEGTNQRVARFMVPGVKLAVLPEPGQPPTAAIQVGEFSIRLVRFFTGLNAGPGSSAPVNGGVFSQVEFQVTHNGAPTVLLRPSFVSISDTQWRTVDTSTQQTGRRGSNVVINFFGRLDPEAGPYRLLARFFPQPFQTPEEMAVFTNFHQPGSPMEFQATPEVFTPGAK